MIRLINICVIAGLFLAAAYVYKIKFESTQRAEQVAKLRAEIRREHDATAALRAEWSRLDTPARIQELAKRHLALKPIEQRQFDRLDQLPERPAPLVPSGVSDPIGFLIALPDLGDMPTASIPAPKKSER
jgi:cell division protein FtsL